MSNEKKKKKGGQTDLFKQLGLDLDPRKEVDELAKMAKWLDEQSQHLKDVREGIISPSQLSAESRAEWVASGQAETIARAAYLFIRSNPNCAFFDIDNFLRGYGVNNSGTLTDLEKKGLIIRSEYRTKNNPNTGRRCSTFTVANPKIQINL